MVTEYIIDPEKWKQRVVVRKTTSVKIDPEMWKLAKKRAIDEESQVSEYIEDLILADVIAAQRSARKDRELKAHNKQL